MAKQKFNIPQPEDDTKSAWQRFEDSVKKALQAPKSTLDHIRADEKAEKKIKESREPPTK